MYLVTNTLNGSMYAFETKDELCKKLDINKSTLNSAIKRGNKILGCSIKWIDDYSEQAKKIRYHKKMQAINKFKEKYLVVNNLNGELTEIIEITGKDKFIIHGRYISMNKFDNLANLKVVKIGRSNEGLRMIWAIKDGVKL